MNGKYFIDHILKKLEKKVKEKYGKEKVYLHYDNSPIHKCNIVQKFISKHKLKILNHLPYSPDLTPSDFSLFGILKTILKGKLLIIYSVTGKKRLQKMRKNRGNYIK
jgi:hypothetical protein